MSMILFYRCLIAPAAAVNDVLADWPGLPAPGETPSPYPGEGLYSLSSFVIPTLPIQHLSYGDCLGQPLRLKPAVDFCAVLGEDQSGH